MNVQAIHVYQLVHAQGHVHDALDSSPQYRMQLHDLMLMLHSSLRLFNMQFGISGETGLRTTISRNTGAGSQHLIFKSKQFFCG